MKRFVLLVPMLLAGCIGPIYDSLDEPSSSTWVDESEPPRPTTGTGTTTWGAEQDMAVEPETTDDATATVEIVEFSASTHHMMRAGSVLLFAEVVGEHTGLSLLVHRNGELVTDEQWALGESTHEFKVTSDALDGELEFTLQAMTGVVVLDSEKLSVEVDLPESGTKDFRWVSPAVSRGLAVGVIPGTGTEADTIVAVGNDPDDVLLMGVMANGAVPVTALPRMRVHAIDVADGFIFVAGERDGYMVVRKYTDAFQQFWEFKRPNARALDVEVGPDGDVYVVGEVDEDGMFPHTQAAIWVLTESASLIKSAQFATFDEWNVPRASSLAAVGFVDERVVGAGYREAYDGLFPPRATIFELADGNLFDRDMYTGTFITEECGWNTLVVSGGDIFAAGWHQVEPDTPSSVAFGRFSEELNGEVFSPAWGGFGSGKAIAWQNRGAGFPVVAGQRTVGIEPRLFVQAEPWSQPYIDDGGDRSWAHDVVVDRHGYIYAVGDLVENDEPHLVLVRLNP